MSYYSPAVEQILQQTRKRMRETKTMIKTIEKDAPILTTIVNYGGQSSVQDILKLEHQDQVENSYNKFEKILLQSADNSGDQRNSKKYLSFIQYKAQPSKAKLPQNRRSKKSLRTSIIVQMPSQLKQMKNEILSLPSVNQSRFSGGIRQKSNSGSRLLQQLRKSQSKRYQTQASYKPASNVKRSYLLNLRDILSQFESPQIQCNGYIQARHDECKRMLQHKEHLYKQYNKFQSLGSPPNKIINLNNLISKFQSTIDKSLDSQLVRQINNMDNKRYDFVLKHEQQIRKLNMAKFQQKKKQEKIEQCKNSMNDIQKSDKLGFKLNSKGKEIYTNRLKTVK